VPISPCLHQMLTRCMLLTTPRENPCQRTGKLYIYYDYSIWLCVILILHNCHTVKPELAATFIKQLTFQTNRMFPNFNFALIFTSAVQPPALSSHFLCFPWVAAKHRVDCKCQGHLSSMGLLKHMQ